MPRIIDTPELYTLYCDSWADYIDYTAKRKFTWQGCEASRDTKGMHHAAWSGTNTFPEAQKLALHGWPEGIAHAKNYSASLVNHVSNLVLRPELVYDTEGTDFDVSLVVQNEPECWQRWEDGRTVISGGSQVIRLIFNGTVSAGISQDVMISKGAAISALVELLEIAGRRVEVTLSYAVNTGSGKIQYYITVKSPEQPLELDRLVYALAHPACFRRLGFSLFEGSPERFYSDYYGLPAECDESANPEVLYIPSNLLGFSPTNAVETEAWIKSQLLKQGVVLTED